MRAESSEERVANLLTTVDIYVSQVRHNPSVPLIEKINKVGQQKEKLDHELFKLASESQRLREDLRRLIGELGESLPNLESIGWSKLKELLKVAQDKLSQQKSKIVSCTGILVKMWDIMAIDPIPFQLEPDTFKASYLEKLEREKQRLFDLQKERFKEMLAEQERELHRLWDVLEESQAERQTVLESFRACTFQWR